MSGVGSTNAMKKGSGNNPFLASTEAEMRTFLNSSYVGCIVKYTGDAIQREITDANRTTAEHAQNIVFKKYAFPELALKNGASINIFEKDSEGTVTESYIVNGAIKNGVFYYDKSSLTTPYVDVLAWVDAKANNANVKAVLYDSVYRWHHDTVNDQQMITLWSYSDDVTFTITGDLSGFELLMYIEPYKVGELYKVVYSGGEYYFEEYCYISEYKTTGNSDYIAPGKTMYDFTGELQVGNGSKVNPYIASTADEMAAYLTSSYKGAFVKYIGETVAVGGTPAPVNPIAVGDTITQLYFDTTKTPDFSLLDWSNAEDVEGLATLALVNSDGLSAGQAHLRIVRVDNTLIPQLQGTMYQLQNSVSDGTNLYIQCAPEDVAFCEGNGITPNQWIAESNPFPFDAAVVVSAVNQQDIWGAYISKDGQWTSGGGASYVKNAIYQVAEDGDTTMYMVLPTLTNEGTASDLAAGKQLINSKGEIIDGELEKVTNYLPSLAADELEELPFDAFKGCTKLSDYALYNKKNLKTINVPATLKTFGRRITEECSNLTKVNIESLRAWLESTFGEYGNLVINAKHLYVNNKLLTNLVKNDTDGITNISAYAFQSCTDLTTVELADSVETIGSSVFSQCTNLTTFSAKSVTTIPERCFDGASLVSIDIPNVTIIKGAYSMGGGSRKSLIGKDLIFPKVTRVDQSAFYYCGAKSMSFPVLVKAIGSFTFHQNNYLEQIDLPNMEDMPSSYFLYSCTKINKIVLPKLITFRLGGISYCNSLKTIDLPSVTTISDYSSSCFSSMSNVRLLLRYNGVVSLSAKQLPNAITEVYVQSEQVDNYKTDAKWSVYANKIKSLDDFVE